MPCQELRGRNWPLSICIFPIPPNPMPRCQRELLSHIFVFITTLFLSFVTHTSMHMYTYVCLNNVIFCLACFDIFIKIHLCCLTEKAMAPHSSTLAWKIPWMAEPGRLQSMGSLGVGHDWAISLYFFTFMYWRRKWQPTPVFLPGESQGRGSLVGCCLWGRTESDTTEAN